MDGGLITAGAFAACVAVILIAIALAADNAVVVGALAARLPAGQRRKLIWIGIAAATVLRIAFALIVDRLFLNLGLVLGGGLLLLWVAWRMYREIRHKDESAGSDEIIGDEHSGLKPAKTLAGAAVGIALADLGFALDNVIGVAGAAHDRPGVLEFSLILSVVLMGAAAGFIAKLVDRHRWLAWASLVAILWVGLKMIFEGSRGLAPVIAPLFT